MKLVSRSASLIYSHPWSGVSGVALNMQVEIAVRYSEKVIEWGFKSLVMFFLSTMHLWTTVVVYVVSGQRFACNSLTRPSRFSLSPLSSKNVTISSLRSFFLLICSWMGVEGIM